MGEITTIGLDLAKHVFQVHGVDADGAMVLRKQLRRGQVLAFFGRLPSCVVGMEACATAHHWARELIALGHEVKLMELCCQSARNVGSDSQSVKLGREVGCDYESEQAYAFLRLFAASACRPFLR